VNEPKTHSGPSSAVRMISHIEMLSAPTVSSTPKTSISGIPALMWNAAGRAQSKLPGRAATSVAPSAMSEPSAPIVRARRAGPMAMASAVASGIRMSRKSIIRV